MKIIPQNQSTEIARVVAQPSTARSENASSPVDQHETHVVSSPPSRATSASPALQVPSPGRALAPTTVPELPSAEAFDLLLDASSDFLNNDRFVDALRLLLPQAATPEAHNSWAFQARLSQAFIGTAASLKSGNVLGAFNLHLEEGALPRMTSERLDLYAGALSASARYLAILREPSTRQAFIAKHGAATLETCEEGINAGMAHALTEAHIFITLVCQINMNHASREFVERSLESGRLDPESSLVRAFREVREEPLYDEILGASEEVNRAWAQANVTSQGAWVNWSNKEHDGFNAWLGELLRQSGGEAQS
jgi:hypothetical protein